MTDRRWHLLEVGDRRATEFSSVVAWLDDHPAVQSHLQVRRLSEGCAIPQVTDHPDVIVVWQSYSDEYPADDVQRLLACWPLARVVCVYGAWCAADGRIRTHWPPRFRVSVEQARQRLELELQSLSGSSVPACPWTATVDEVWRWSQEHATPVALSGLRFVLQIPDRVLRDSVQAELLAAKAINSEASAADAHVVVIDVEPWTPLLRERVLQVREQFPSAVLVGLTGWVTHDQGAALQACGIRICLSKTAPETWRQVLQESTSRRAAPLAERAI